MTLLNINQTTHKRDAELCDYPIFTIFQQKTFKFELSRNNLNFDHNYSNQNLDTVVSATPLNTVVFHAEHDAINKIAHRNIYSALASKYSSITPKK